jgi:hypothetical protein
MGSLTTPSAMVRKFLGFDEGSELNPSLVNLSFACKEVNPFRFSMVRFVFKGSNIYFDLFSKANS